MARQHRRGGGFTLIEILIVMALLAMLASLALPRYFASLELARETVLRENLRTTREAIDRFHHDTDHYPDSLQQLVARRYLRELPLDPLTERRDSWLLLPPQAPERGAVADLRSSAAGTTRDGRAFNQL